MTSCEAIEQNQNVRAVYLTAEDLKIACSLLFQAYRDDPVFCDIFQVNLEGYETRLRSAIREELNAFWAAKQPMIGLFDDERMVAVACLNSSEAAFGAGRFWHWRLKMLLTAGYFCTMQMLEKEQKVRENVPAEHFHMLSFIGVHPDAQHHGLGHILMSAVEGVMLEDDNSSGIAVYATLDKYRHFFENGGYRLIKELEVGNIKGHLMFRDRTNSVANPSNSSGSSSPDSAAA
ncbi:GNAT family N-acetyltransferase [Paraneptunicella aestuarii]|uniref:GNAT family N-acetyltransferase n=1 Tax=Paraneptunicella aestuarii TaxID=2831148 RepID=UPI001E42D145|nr:GNAT family N-acetyltransferase [Paraneptunicella aestuarii]UAA39697.1 GNAT family N-acetyltransferase [Paraneptunicella aestuarii]